MSKSTPLAGNPADSVTTADTLLDTAEHLFARQGIENVSLRRIAAECGHGNRSGALYHFGSREALISKLLERRMEVVNAIRHRRLDELTASGRDDDLGALIACAINVLSEVVRQYAWGADYVLVMAQALFNPRIEPLTTIDADALSGHTRSAAMARKLLPELPAEKFNARMRMVTHETVYSIARWIQLNGELTASNTQGFDAMIETVAEFMGAGLAAPTSVAATGAAGPGGQPAPQQQSPATGRATRRTAARTR